MSFLSDNTAIITLLALTVLVLLLLGVVIWAAVKGAGQPAPGAAPPARQLSSDSLKQSFKVAVELIEANLAARNERYNLSWTLVLNEGPLGRELPLVQSGLQSALSADSTLTASGQGISWNFFDQGVAIQLQTDCLGPSDPADAAASNTWDNFLGLCRSYRPDRPFDGIVLSIPASALLEGDGEGQGQLDLLGRAKAIHRRLWLAQNRLALRFPIYLVVSGCDAIPGFARFAAALPEPLRRSMLGWSAPYELAAPFQGQWVDAALNDIVRTLSDSCAELCALEPAGSDSSAYFMLPTEVERLRAGLKLFAEELMRPSAYHEPFLLRGFYLTGDCSDAAVLMDGAALAPAADLPLLDEAAPAAESAAVLAAPAQDAWPDALALPGDGDGARQANAMPAFLRDIFERKIFAETGLVRSASSQRMRRPRLNQAVRWGALALPAVWVVGMGFGGARLHGLAGPMVDQIERLKHDDAASVRTGPAPDPGVSRARALEALQSIEKLGAARLGSVFMPGSWPSFDSLHERLQSRMEKGFADNAFEPLRRDSYQRVSLLTGVPVDPVTGTLIIGADCTLPLQWAQKVAGGADAINVEDLPEFGATLQYVAQVEQTEKLLTAMMRLKAARPGAASGDDLALVVRMLLGAELNGNTGRIAELFRQAAQGVPSLIIDPVQEASACALKQAVKATGARLFGANGLLQAEKAIGVSAAAVLDAGPRPADPGVALEAWLELHEALRTERRLIGAGKGAWMHGQALALGPAWENMLARIEASPLLGKGAADDARRQVDNGFKQFVADWDAALEADVLADGMGTGLVWSDEAKGWTFGEERQALLAALDNLLGQPYMRFNTKVRWPEVPAGATVSWDSGRLDQVLALADARKRFHTELLPKFPAPLQSQAASLADAGLVETARDLLAQAYFVNARDTQAPAGDGGRARALRVRSWLDEIGAGGAADDLAGVMARDALSRLQQLDDTLARAQLFVPRDRAFKDWSGQKGPLLDAFGAADAGALGAYVAQQQAYIDAAGREAEGLLQQLGGIHGVNPLVLRWQATVADLARYRLKSPTSSLMALEQFILTGAADLDLGNCLDRLSARAAQRRGSDLFSERMQLLQAGLYTRCRELAQSGFEDGWSRFAEAFNRDLANRAPFRLPRRDAALKGEAGAAADVGDVGNVLKLYERVHALGIASDRDTSRPSAPSGLRKVDEQMRLVRELLAPLYPAEGGQPGGLDVTVEFRANSAAEVDGNQIIDWTLAIGSQQLRRRDPARMLRWEPGMPVTLALRLAQDGPLTPRPDPAQPGMAVDGRTVSYRFDDPWALLSFVAAHRESESGAGARSQLLKFEFPAALGGEAARLSSRDTRARVFVRIGVSAPGKRTMLAWPAAFPVRVPGW